MRRSSVMSRLLVVVLVVCCVSAIPSDVAVRRLPPLPFGSSNARGLANMLNPPTTTTTTGGNASAAVSVSGPPPNMIPEFPSDAKYCIDFPAVTTLDNTVYVFGYGTACSPELMETEPEDPVAAAVEPDAPAVAQGVVFYIPLATAAMSPFAGWAHQLSSLITGNAGLAVTVGDAMYFMGGQTQGGRVPVATVLRVTPGGASALTFTKLADMPNGGRLQAGSYVNGTTVVVVGGYTKEPQATLETFDTVTGTWVNKGYPALSNKRFAHATARVGPRVFVAGGLVTAPGSNKPVFLDSIEVWDTRDSAGFQTLPITLPHKIAYLGAAAYACQLYIFGGMLPQTATSKNVAVDTAYMADPWTDPVSDITLYPSPGGNLSAARQDFGYVSLPSQQALYVLGGIVGDAAQITQLYLNSPCPINTKGPNCFSSSAPCNFGYENIGGVCKTCDGFDVDSDVCAGPCSGHGKCSAGSTCTCDPLWDPAKNCGACLPPRVGPACLQCPDHTWGPDCEPCPVDSGGIVCGGHGTCVGSGTTHGNGTCQCTDNFDPATNCTTCLPFHHESGGKCNKNCPVAPNGLECNGLGPCVKGVCQCDLRKAHGPSCEICAYGRAGVTCEIVCPGPEGTEPGDSAYVPCFGRGLCDMGHDRPGTCSCVPGTGNSTTCDCDRIAGPESHCTSCPEGFFGPQCEPCPSGRLSRTHAGNVTLVNACAGKGTCAPDITVTNYEDACACDRGFNPTYNCTSCVSGYWDVEECKPCVGLTNPENYGPATGGAPLQQCYSHGKCSETDGSCPSCNAGWSGDTCCSWLACPSSPWAAVMVTAAVVGIILAVFVLYAGPYTKAAFFWLVPPLQLMSLAVHTPAVRFLAIMAENRPPALVSSSYSTPGVVSLRNFMSGLGLVLGNDFWNFPYFQWCPSGAPSALVLGILPLLGPVITALVGLIPVAFFVRDALKADSAPGGTKPSADAMMMGMMADDGAELGAGGGAGGGGGGGGAGAGGAGGDGGSSRSMVLFRRYLGRIFVFASIFYLPFITKHAIDSFSCSKRDFCDTNRLNVLCDSSSRWPLFGVGVFSLLAVTASLCGVLVFLLVRNWLRTRQSKRTPEDEAFDEASTDGSYPMRISTPKPRILLRSLPMFEFLTALVSDASAWWSLALFLRRVILIVLFSIQQVAWGYKLLATLLVTGVWVLARMYAQIFDRATSNRLYWADFGLALLEVWYLSMIALITKDVNDIDAAINPNKATVPPSSSTSQAQSAALAAVAAAALAVILVAYVLFRALWDDVSLHRQAKAAAKSGRAPLLADVGAAGGAMVVPTGAGASRSSKSSKKKKQQQQQQPVAVVVPNGNPGGQPAFLAANAPNAFADAPLQSYVPPEMPVGAGFVDGGVPPGTGLMSPGAATAATGTTTGTTKSKKSKKNKKAKGGKKKRKGPLERADSLDESAPVTDPRLKALQALGGSIASGMGAGTAGGGAAGAPAAQTVGVSGGAVAAPTLLTSPQASVPPAPGTASAMYPYGGALMGTGTSGTPPIAPGSATGSRAASAEVSLDSLSRSRSNRKRLGKKGKKGKKGTKGKRTTALSPEDIAEDRPLSPGEAVAAQDLLAGLARSPTAYETASRGADSVSGFSSVSRGLQFEEEAKCLHCGVAVLASARFCHQCGGNVEMDAAHASRVLSDDGE